MHARKRLRMLDVEKAITILTIILTALATVLSRQKDGQDYAATRAYAPSTNGNGNGYSAAINAESKRLDMLDRRVDRLDSGLREALHEQGEQILAAISRMSMETNERFRIQNEIIGDLRKDVDKILMSQNGNGSKHE